MAVYQHNYQSYSGQLSPLWSRFLIIPRYAYQGVFQSRIFTGFFAVCFAPLLVAMVFIYLRHNLTALAAFNIRATDLVDINAFFFRIFTYWQTSLGFLLTVIIGPSLISRDLSNNALPLYLCRPLTRSDYVIGKMTVLMILLSLITWIPLLLLFVFQAVLQGGSWLWENLYVARAIFITSWTWIILLSLLSIALSAWVKWRIAASAILFGIFVVPTPIAISINELFHTSLGTLFHPGFLTAMLMDKMFRLSNAFPDSMVPTTWSMWVSLSLLALICIGLLALKVRAYEVIK